MGQPGSNEAVARIAPMVLAHFGQRGLVDFRTLPGNPPVLFITVQLLAMRSSPGDLTTLWSLARDAGLQVERGWNFDDVLAVEITLKAAHRRGEGVVVPFRRPHTAQE